MLGDLLRVAPGAVSLVDVDPRSTPGFEGDKATARQEIADLAPEVADLQERLWAQGRTGGHRRLLVVLQGMDTSGKGGAVKQVDRLVGPMSLRAVAFGKPTEEELAQDFLWRVERQLPPAGTIGVFDRSHYEDVLIVRVHDLVLREEWESRYERINAWEESLADQGVELLKVMLHISPDEQRERLLARLDDPTKRWKANPGDVDERRHWHEYMAAYEAALARCSTEQAPWYVVPADRKWYRDWALTHLLLERLRSMDLEWPQPDLDLDAMRAALVADPSAHPEEQP